MNDLKIIMPKMTSDHFYAFMNKNGNDEVVGTAKELKSTIAENSIDSLRYGTSNYNRRYNNFVYVGENRSVKHRAQGGVYLPGNMGAAKENIIVSEKRAPIVKEQFIDKIVNCGKRKITDIYSMSASHNRYTSTQTIERDGTYQVLRMKNGVAISGYRCNLNDIANTAEIYDKNAKAFVKQIQKKVPKTLKEILSKIK